VADTAVVLMEVKMVERTAMDYAEAQMVGDMVFVLMQGRAGVDRAGANWDWRADKGWMRSCQTHRSDAAPPCLRRCILGRQRDQMMDLSNADLKSTFLLGCLCKPRRGTDGVMTKAKKAAIGTTVTGSKERATAQD
jgi:hypothetical protein